MAFGAHFSRTVAKFKVSINPYYHQSGLYTHVASETHFFGGSSRDQCFTLQGGFQRPLSSSCLTFLVGSKSNRVALSSLSCLSKQVIYLYVWFGNHISPKQHETSLCGIQECWGDLNRLNSSIQLGLHTLCAVWDPHLS
jgi:hypothetical protein